ncbi:MAG: hypothetical protein LRS49_00550, partial [Desulfurococcales archaeon]|nr:hypothetical protein [Desulfurococcales archaeon]
PIAEDTASAYSAIRKAPPEERNEIARKMIASFEPLFLAAPHVEKMVHTILATSRGALIPREKHENFIKHLERTQIRRALE